MPAFRWFGAALAAPVLLASPGPAAAQDSTFLLATTDQGRAPSPFIGNGRLSVVIPALGVGASHSFLAGLYEEAPGDVPRIALTPAWNAVALYDGERWLDTIPFTPFVRAYRQAVDLRSGAARTEYEWSAGTRSTGVTVETFVSRAAPHLAVMRVELRPRQSGRYRVRFALAGWPPPARLALARLERSDPAWTPADVWYPGHMLVRSAEAARDSAGARLALTSTPAGRTTLLAQAAAIGWEGALPGAVIGSAAGGDTAQADIAFDASAGESYRFLQVTSVVATSETPYPLALARREAALARARGFDSLAADNARAWAERWRTDIEIEGDPELQRVVRSMLFYLLASADRGTGLGIPPMGLSSGGYYGHIFWDSDTWMFPSLLVTHPDIARSLVAFRRHTLEAARARAREHGYRGAMYPWEADERGRETTPRFAIQNALSEVHVTGDVAFAQWQYYLATGDSAWLARDGYPVIRETADFWVSRTTHDAAADRYHIENVVSVHEGLIGVTDDAYTNAVARKNLEIAVAASRRLGRTADPRWARVAERLHLPYDSASQFYRTYEGAPDSTLGAVTPLLAYPLGVPMSERAKRAQLEQAVERLLAEGAGAMMGSTLLSVDAAELGDRALLDSLLPHSYRQHLRGPFLMLSETPTNDAVNFVTGAGGFLQQVIFGWTGLRIGDGGLDPAFPPLLPSRVRRLTLRNVHARGERYDVVVDSGGRRIVRHGEAPDTGRRRAPALEFPEPGLDDTAAYGGYRTRFYRDARDNTVQIYLARESGRVVHLLANAANESIGFTVRDAGGRPVTVEWAAPEAEVGDSGGTRVLEYRLAAPARQVEIGGFVLGSMRVERDFQYAGRHLRPFGAAPFRVAEESLLVAAVARLPPAERGRHLAALDAQDVQELRDRLVPRIRLEQEDTAWVARIERPSLDGRNRLALELRGDARQSAVTSDGRTLRIAPRAGAAMSLAVRVSTDAAPLAPLAGDEIFNSDFRAFMASAAAARDSAGRTRYRRLERQVRGVELLSSRDKLMAGLPNFATYFGRDMMMTALMMRPIWTAAMSEHVIAGVLRKLGPGGEVSHEEALGGQAIREHAVVYDSLVRAGRHAAARSLLGRLQTPRENYHMIDDEFQLPVLVARYLTDSTVPAGRRRAFLLERDNGRPRLDRLLEALELVAELSRRYAENPTPRNLVSFPRLENGRWRSASWRDSDAGYAGGRFAMDVNAVWVPQALASLADIIQSLEALDLTVVPSQRSPVLRTYLTRPTELRRAVDTWRGAHRHFIVSLGPAEVKRRATARLVRMPVDERRWWQEVAHGTDAFADSLTFLALALDDAGNPVPVVNTDPATHLFLEPALGLAELRLDLDPILRPYPAGLLVDGLGPVVANDAYAGPSVWRRFGADTYHAPRVVWGREVNLLLLGLAQHLASSPDPETAEYLAHALRRINHAVEASGLQHNELWSYRVTNGTLEPIRYGTSSDVQLWNSTDLAVQFVLSRLQQN